MSVIEKKVLPEYFQAIVQGRKTFELRLADWNCKEGDTLKLREFDGQDYTGREIVKNVGFVLKTKDLQLFSDSDVEEYGYQVISLIDEKKP